MVKVTLSPPSTKLESIAAAESNTHSHALSTLANKVSLWSLAERRNRPWKCVQGVGRVARVEGERFGREF